MKREQSFSIKGMTRDISRSKSGTDYAYEIKNMRITAQEGESMLTLTNEKGNKQYALSIDDNGIIGTAIKGNIIGAYVLNGYLIVFSHETGSDYIYRFTDTSKGDNLQLSGVVLYNKNLGFTNDMRLEILGIVESENIQKVYWLDGVHQPRFILISGTTDKVKERRKKYETMSTPFDFVPVFNNKEKITITKETYGGYFPEGTIQYAFSYYNLYGQQSNIFYISPLYYISPVDKGAAADKSVYNSFKISIENADTTYDYIRIYSIHRSAYDGTPSCKVVADLKINKE